MSNMSIHVEDNRHVESPLVAVVVLHQIGYSAGFVVIERLGT